MQPPMMLPIESRLRTMFAGKLVGIIRVNDTQHCLSAAHALNRAGFKMIEVTLTAPGALDIIKELAANAAEDVMIGAGTVMSAYDTRACIENGAQFIVSPICELDIVRPCRDAGVVAIPGAMSPTEIMRAWRFGAHVIKVWPAGNVGGPAFIRALRGPLPDIPLWVSGNVFARDAQEYLRAGAQLVGLGPELLPPAMMDAGDWDGVTEHARRLLLQARGEALA